MPEDQVFQGVTPEQFALLQSKAAGAGIEMHGNTGSASKFGVDVEWNYHPDTRQLSVHCVKAPFFMSIADVNSKIRNLVKESLA